MILNAYCIFRFFVLGTTVQITIYFYDMVPTCVSEPFSATASPGINLVINMPSSL